MSSERRRHTRARTEHTVELCTIEGQTSTASLQDVSADGLFLHCEPDLPVGTQCHITIVLDGADPPVRVEADGEVVRCATHGLGLRIRPDGVDSSQHLFRLILMNAEDPDGVVEELRPDRDSPGPTESFN